MPDFLFDFQADLVQWAIRRGRAAIFADCGLGKTPMQLVWSENVARFTGGRVLVLTPLGVAAQTVREADKFGIEVERSSTGEASTPIVVTNYERLHHFRPDDFSGVVCDESSILKSYAGVRRGEITAFMRKVPYRLLCSATAAPNDYIELGTSSEALGGLGYTDMLTRFFKNDQNTVRPIVYRQKRSERAKWRFKGHAEDPFWRWVCSWARAIRRPSDLGYEDAAFILPALVEREHAVTARTLADGMLFTLPAVGLREERDERRRTLAERCEAVAAMVAHDASAIVWCHLNDEGDMLESLIPRSVQVSGADDDDAKEEKFALFTSGQARVLITKPKIGAWGLNFQHCAHVVTFASHSFEQYYQSVRRCWRFGQTRPVIVDIVSTEGEAGASINMRRKAAAADRMFSRLVVHMRNAITIDGERTFPKPVEVPSWL